MSKKELILVIIMIIVIAAISFGSAWHIRGSRQSEELKCKEIQSDVEDNTEAEDISKEDQLFGMIELDEYNYICERDKDDGTEFGKEHCVLEIGYFRVKDEKYYIKAEKNNDGENAMFGYTYGFFINEKKVLDKKVSKIELINDKIIVSIDGEAGSTVPILSTILMDLEGNILKELSNNTYYIDYELIDIASENSQIIENIILYNRCENGLLSKHRLSLNNLSDDKIIYKEKVELCSMTD